MTSPLSTIPFDPNRGGSRFGHHFLSTFRKCPMKWYLTYLAPRPNDGGAGGDLPAAPNSPRHLGSVFHAGVAGWYMSGWRDGHYDLDAARAAILDPSKPWDDETRASAIALMERHHRYCGPGGTIPEFNHYRVAYIPAHTNEKGEHVPDKPLIETTLTVPLGYRDYVFTSTLDVVLDGHGRLFPCDHKTADASRVSATERQYAIDGQLSGQLMCSQQLWPDAPFSGDALINIIIKRAAAANPPRRLVPVSRRPLDIEIYRHHAIATLKQIEDAMEHWGHLRSLGHDVNSAALLAFNSYPSGDSCFGNYPCDFYDACLTRERLHDTFYSITVPRVGNGASEGDSQ